MTGTVRVEFWVDGAMVDAANGATAVSYATATVLIGQSDGVTPYAPSRYFIDDASLATPTEQLGNRSFESAIKPVGLGLATGNWGRYRNGGGPTPDRTTTNPRTGSYSFEINRPTSVSGVSYCFQDASGFSSENLRVGAWLYKASTYGSAGGISLQVLFNWDRSHGYASGVVGATQASSGGVSWSGYDVGGSGLPSTLLPYDDWTYWELRVYPSGRHNGCAVGMILAN